MGQHLCPGENESRMQTWDAVIIQNLVFQLRKITNFQNTPKSSVQFKAFHVLSAVMLKAACLVFSSFSVDKSFRINHNLLFLSLPIVAKLKKILIFMRNFQPECINVTIQHGSEFYLYPCYQSGRSQINIINYQFLLKIIIKPVFIALLPLYHSFPFPSWLFSSQEEGKVFLHQMVGD